MRNKLVWIEDVFADLMRMGWSCTDATNFVKSLKAAAFATEDNVGHNPSGWIHVSDRQPEEDGTYIVTTTSGAVTTARFYADRVFYRGQLEPYHRTATWARNRNVTHWMPLPEPPQEVSR